MEIFTTKAFGFTKPGVNPSLNMNMPTETDVVQTKPGAFQTVPDWVKETDLFKDAVKDGAIKVTVAPSKTDSATVNKAKGKK